MKLPEYIFVIRSGEEIMSRRAPWSLAATRLRSITPVTSFGSLRRTMATTIQVWWRRLEASADDQSSRFRFLLHVLESCTNLVTAGMANAGKPGQSRPVLA